MELSVRLSPVLDVVFVDSSNFVWVVTQVMWVLIMMVSVRFGEP